MIGSPWYIWTGFVGLARQQHASFLFEPCLIPIRTQRALFECSKETQSCIRGGGYSWRAILSLEYQLYGKFSPWNTSSFVSVQRTPDHIIDFTQQLTSDSRRTHTVTQKAATWRIQMCDSTHYIPPSTVTKLTAQTLDVHAQWRKRQQHYTFKCVTAHTTYLIQLSPKATCHLWMSNEAATYLIQTCERNLAPSNVCQQHTSFKCITATCLVQMCDSNMPRSNVCSHIFQ